MSLARRYRRPPEELAELLAGWKQELESVDQAMDLGGAAPTRAAYGLEEGPPFAPAADRCALTWVASIAAP